MQEYKTERETQRLPAHRDAHSRTHSLTRTSLIPRSPTDLQYFSKTSQPGAMNKKSISVEPTQPSTQTELHMHNNGGGVMDKKLICFFLFRIFFFCLFHFLCYCCLYDLAGLVAASCKSRWTRVRNHFCLKVPCYRASRSACVTCLSACPSVMSQRAPTDVADNREQPGVAYKFPTVSHGKF